MDLAYAYAQIENRLEKLDFSALFRGFRRLPFALYDDTRVYFEGAYVEKTASFLGNTSILYNGAHTAIWKLSDDAPDFDVLTSKIVHEMLHAFQNVSGETRWADERAALVKYRYSEANFAARLEEAECMRICLTEGAQDTFRKLLSLRKARMERFPYAYDYESRIEQIEGTAHFVELAALTQLDEEKAAKSRADMLEALADPARYFPVRHITYFSGAAFLACLRRYTDFDTDAFTDTPFALAALENAQPCSLPEHDARVSACFAEWQAQAEKQIAQTIQKGELVLEGTYRLIMWNVFDAAWNGKYAILTSFFGYIEGMTLPDTDEALFAQMKVLNGDFVAELDDTMRLSRVWRQ